MEPRDAGRTGDTHSGIVFDPELRAFLAMSREASSEGHAKRVGTSQPTLARIETGNRTPTVRTLLRVARAAGFELVLGPRDEEEA